jgi:hypothetical protein
MKRLHSYFTYPFVVSPLMFDVWVTYVLFHEFDVSLKFLFVAALLNFINLSVFYVFITNFKRVYLKDSSLYIYDLYSRTPYILPLTELKEVKQGMRVFDRLLGVYKLSFAIEGSYYYYTFSFIKNKLIFNLRKYI